MSMPRSEIASAEDKLNLSTTAYDVFKSASQLVKFKTID